jgi:hypothetical protein
MGQMLVHLIQQTTEYIYGALLKGRYIYMYTYIYFFVFEIELYISIHTYKLIYVQMCLR